jgi:hypothetical protein
MDRMGRVERPFSVPVTCTTFVAPFRYMRIVWSCIGVSIPFSPIENQKSWWSDSNIRIPSQQARLRMLESTDH